MAKPYGAVDKANVMPGCDSLPLDQKLAYCAKSASLRRRRQAFCTGKSVDVPGRMVDLRAIANRRYAARGRTGTRGITGMRICDAMMFTLGVRNL